MTSPINVLELRSVRGTGGGPEKTILLGAAAADPAACRVTVCYVRDDRDPVFGIDHRASAARVDYAEVRERHSLDMAIWPQLRNLVHQRGIDIVHAHDYKTDLLALLLARRTSVVPLATAHGWTGDSAKERLAYYPADKRLLARFPRVLAVSHEIRRTLIRRGARPERVEVLLNGIDPAMFQRVPDRGRDVRSALGIPDSCRLVGAVGRLERQKRFDLLLEAFAGFSDLHLAIVGDGSLRAALETRAHALGMRRRCHFLGHREDVADLHNAFDLFVQSSDYEGTPNAVLEAMALETPVVATDAGGTADLVTHLVHGLVVPIGDVLTLRAAMRQALVDREQARERARAARLRIETELSFVARTRRLEAVYRELVDARSGGSRSSASGRASGAAIVEARRA
jgi:glycosyltransferase involved in cell wall biosynthesis